MAVNMNVWGFLAVTIVSILIFITIIILIRKKKNITLSKEGVKIDNDNDDAYLITELLRLHENIFYLDHIEKIETVMTYFEQVMAIFYGTILQTVRRVIMEENRGVSGDLDFYVYRLVLESNKVYMLNEFKKEIKRIDENTLIVFDNYKTRMRDYFWNKAVDNIDILMKNEIRVLEKDKFKSFVKDIFYREFDVWMEEVRRILNECIQLKLNLKKKLDEIIKKIVEE